MPIISGGSGGGGGAISGVTVTGTAAAGDVPVASSSSAGVWALPPGYEFGYDQITAPVNIASTTEATPTTVISCAAHVFDGAAVLCTVFFPYVETGTAASNNVFVSLWEGATDLGRFGVVGPASTTLQELLPFVGFYRFTPTAASHTYTITAYANSTTGTPQVGADTGGAGGHYQPGFARFTKV